jgi:hypothetical protein
MSRAKHRDNSNPVQLFPFVAVLLCTMGSLLVILVVVARCSWDQGVQQAAATRRADEAGPQAVDELRQKLTAVHSYVEQLGTVRAQAEQKLHGDQIQLSHLEDHMRRMQDHLESLRAAAGELEGLEHEHYDDRAQAEREVARLGQLIDDTKKEIEDLKRSGNGKPRSYAIVPFVGRNGTRRPPIYIECRGKELILEPEGIHLSEDDFAPELGPGSPLAAALRAAREYLVSKYGAGASAAAAEPEPYPLLLVRPKGENAFYESRAVFERCGIQFGYELVDGNWDLKYPPANPELAARETQAIELARGRAKALAEAAPGMLRRGRHGDDLDGGPDDDFVGGPIGADGMGGGGDGDSGGGTDSDGEPGSAGNSFVMGSPTGTGQAGAAAFGASNQGNGSTSVAAGAGGAFQGGAASSGSTATGQIAATSGQIEQAGGGASGDTRGPGLPNLMADARSGSAVGQNNSNGGPPNGGPSGPSSPIAGGSNGYSSGGERYSSDGSPPSGALAGDPVPRSQGPAIIGPPDGASTAAAAATVARFGGRNTAATEVDEDEARPPVPNGPGMYREHPPEKLATKPPDDKPVEKHRARGKNWALVDANSQSTPIRRTIQVVVRGDRVAVLPEGTAAADGVSKGHEIPLTGNSREAYEPFLVALETEIKDWGMAGRGLYWRPVLELNAGPDGQQHAADITRLLKNSGIELRAPSAVAAQNQGVSAGASSSR